MNMTKNKAISMVRRAAKVYGYVKTSEHDGHYIRLYKNETLGHLQRLDDDVEINMLFEHDAAAAYLN